MPRRVFIVHGEDSVTVAFSQFLEKEYGFNTYAPYSGTVFDLVNGRFEKEAIPIPAQKKTAITGQDVYSRLKAAGARLVALITRLEGLSNKDKAKFADQINSLCDKWEK